MGFRVALQLYTVRDDIASDFIDGLARVADIGYEYVEFAGFGNSTATLVSARMHDVGLRAVGAHVPLSVLDEPAPVIDDLAQIDCKHATLPWLPEPMRMDWIGTAAKLDDTAELLAEHGIEFGYHNHAFEFENRGYEMLSSALLHTKLQLDVFWVEKAGDSATRWIERLSTRISSLHCKDLGADGADIEIGDGILDWRSIIDSAKDAGITTLITEMDTPRMPPLHSAKACLEGINRFL